MNRFEICQFSAYRNNIIKLKITTINTKTSGASSVRGLLMHDPHLSRQVVLIGYSFNSKCFFFFL